MEIDRLLAIIIKAIQSGDARHIEKQSNRISVFEVTIEGKKLYPVYDQLRKTIATFLTAEMVGERKMSD